MAIAEDLERRDARAAGALREIERLQVAVDELRAHAGAVAAFLRDLPGALVAQEAEARAAGEARTAAETALREAEAELARVETRGSDADRLAAARALQRGRDALDDAERWLERTRAEADRLAREGVERGHEAEQLERRAAELAGEASLEHDVAPPATGLHGLLDWAARARGQLLVAHAALVTERDKVVREASELTASVLGEPFAATGVAGLRERVERALGGGST